MVLDVTYRPRHRAQGERRRRGPLLLFLALTAVNVAVILYHGNPRDRLPPKPPPRPAPGPVGLLAPRGGAQAAEGTWVYDATAGIRTPGAVQKITTVGLERGQTVAQALSRAGIVAGDINAALASFGSLVDFRRMRPGHLLRARLDAEGGLLSLDIRRGPADEYRTERDAGAWRASRLDIPVTSLPTVVRGVVQSSLWETLEGTGEDPRLAVDIAEIFAWDIDFYSEVHPGDTFAILVEKRYAAEEFIEYGPIVGAEFTTAGVLHEAFRFANDGGAAPSYYDGEGQSLRKQLLKAPLKYGQVTSGFGRRVHPILGYSRAHNGIDYGVPSGTPVWSVGDGRIAQAGWRGGYGNYVEVRHANGWVSEYGHLSRILVRAGQRVTQKDVIALTGSTGLSTGPHLHYGLKLQGRFVNPARQKFERGRSLAGAEKRTFLEEVERVRARLHDGPVARQLPPGPTDRG